MKNALLKFPKDVLIYSIFKLGAIILWRIWIRRLFPKLLFY